MPRERAGAPPGSALRLWTSGWAARFTVWAVRFACASGGGSVCCRRACEEAGASPGSALRLWRLAGRRGSATIRHMGPFAVGRTCRTGAYRESMTIDAPITEYLRENGAQALPLS